MEKPKFNVGELVVLKTHPLLKSYRIKGDGKLVPPILLVREVFIESKKKIICDDETGNVIAELIKYTCTYFNDAKSEFLEVVLYESMLDSFRNLKIEKITPDGIVQKDEKTIIEEIDGYKTPEYKYGEIFRLKTKKIEIYKKRSSKTFKVIKNEEGEEVLNPKESVQYVVNYTSPDFIVCGFKKNDEKNSHYPDGSLKKIVAENLFKIKWFNPFQQKFSEQYVPDSFLTDKMKLD
ncbi:hypothetical protein [Flagellimonas sediminis]|uniref:Uncharacterized protein n=1 Tax=Flagellimonas sediminis TaxID=2696468 RepID=A0A6I5KVI6_9FLAO|nr:hypothetical protein [Allomuricauda sediminis]NDV43975.1 hypothetical protein [Allomuricauda sediminis]